MKWNRHRFGWWWWGTSTSRRSQNTAAFKLFRLIENFQSSIMCWAVQHATNAKKKSKSGRVETTKGSALKIRANDKTGAVFFTSFPLQCNALDIAAIECDAGAQKLRSEKCEWKKELKSRTMILYFSFISSHGFLSLFSYAYRRAKRRLEELWRLRYEQVHESRFFSSSIRREEIKRREKKTLNKL